MTQRKIRSGNFKLSDSVRDRLELYLNIQNRLAVLEGRKQLQLSSDNLTSNIVSSREK